MTNSKDKCCVMGSLVDARNVGTHKSVKLTVHVPAELAMKVFESFGWPTMAEPVAVAIARLNSETTAEVASEDSTTPARARKSWHEMPPAQQAGILCADKSFQSFLCQGYYGLPGPDSETGAAIKIRQLCGVSSRAELNANDAASDHWHKLVSEYRAWMREPEVVP